MKKEYTYTSVTRIAPFDETPFTVESIAKKEWESGDYIVVVVTSWLNKVKIEIANGRMVEIDKGDLLVGALGERYATLEATGSWQEVREDGKMHVLTGAGLFGRMTSRSVHIPTLVTLQYKGHVKFGGNKVNMSNYVIEVPFLKYTTPTVLIVGTSMSAGKTTAAKIIIRQLKKMGLKIVGAKLTGAGRYRDILGMFDAGADFIFDFVDAGLPSSICPERKFVKKLKNLLSRIQEKDADVAVVEVGASPLEPYNGKVAIETIKKQIKCTVLCASDPYAVYGVMKAFAMRPDLVSGVATNTHAGIELVEKLCQVKALNIVNLNTLPDLNIILKNSLGIKS